MNEQRTQSIPDFTFTTYLRATPEQVWEALTDPDITARFWGHSQHSTWVVGSRLEHVRNDGSEIADVVGTVLESEPPYRLAFTFEDPQSAEDPDSNAGVVTFEIEKGRDIVKLTLTHTNLGTPEEAEAMGMGWPAVLSNLKTLLETGEVLPQYPWEFHAEERARRMARNDSSDDHQVS